jgi:UDP-N-acetylmuramoyl-L-alanyl-D-glutamate--2,6-diaminopimelate ligase
MELIEEKKDFTILVDYAHTPDALEKVLLTLREFSPQRIITVFGCGGDRDQKKRPLMGEIAGRLSDLVVITSDNPRTEPPEKIIAEIEEGIKKTGIGEIPLSEKSNHFKGYIAVIDRFEAIKIALQKARKGDIVLVAGKGHENYQIWGEKRLPFDDREQIRKALKEIQCQV